MTISVPVWKLQYISMFTSNYHLTYNIVALILGKNEKNEYKTLKSSTCFGDYNKTIPLEDWEKNEFKEVQDASIQISHTCSEQFIKEFGI